MSLLHTQCWKALQVNKILDACGDTIAPHKVLPVWGEKYLGICFLSLVPYILGKPYSVMIYIFMLQRIE